MLRQAELEFLARKIPISAIGRLLGVHRLTVTAFIKEHKGKMNPVQE